MGTGKERKASITRCLFFSLRLGGSLSTHHGRQGSLSADTGRPEGHTRSLIRGETPSSPARGSSSLHPLLSLCFWSLPPSPSHCQLPSPGLLLYPPPYQFQHPNQIQPGGPDAPRRDTGGGASQRRRPFAWGRRGAIRRGGAGLVTDTDGGGRRRRGAGAGSAGPRGPWARAAARPRTTGPAPWWTPGC